MTVGLVLEVLAALLKFPTELSAFIKLISKTPAEQRADLMKKIEEDSAALDRGERPRWDV